MHDKLTAGEVIEALRQTAMELGSRCHDLTGTLSIISEMTNDPIIKKLALDAIDRCLMPIDSLTDKGQSNEK